MNVLSETYLPVIEELILPKTGAERTEYLVLVCDLTDVCIQSIKNRLVEWKKFGIIPNVPISSGATENNLKEIRRKMLE